MSYWVVCSSSCIYLDYLISSSFVRSWTMTTIYSLLFSTILVRMLCYLSIDLSIRFVTAFGHLAAVPLKRERFFRRPLLYQSSAHLPEIERVSWQSERDKGNPNSDLQKVWGLTDGLGQPLEFSLKFFVATTRSHRVVAVLVAAISWALTFAGLQDWWVGDAIRVGLCTQFLQRALSWPR